MGLYQLFNGPRQTTTAPSPVTTGAATLKTLMQVVAGATKGFSVVEWGISFTGSAAATPGTVELIEVDAGATITQYVTADISRVDPEALLDGDPVTALIDCSSTTKSGYTASGEGSVTALRNLCAPQLIAPTNQFIQQFPLGEEPYVQIAKFARIRTNFPAAVTALCYMKIRF